MAKTRHTGIKISQNQQLSTLLFAEDQVIITDREDNLQRAAHKLNQIITEYGLTISVQKKNRWHLEVETQ
jgi:hypothetical protein